MAFREQSRVLFGHALATFHPNSCRFHDEVAFDGTFNGLVSDSCEGDRLASVLNGKKVLLHRSHGVIVCGRSVAEAFDDLYYLERAAHAQVLALSTGSKLSIIRDEVVRATKAAFDAEKAYSARLHLDAWKRQLKREDDERSLRASIASISWQLVAGIALTIGLGIGAAWTKRRH